MIIGRAAITLDNDLGDVIHHEPSALACKDQLTKRRRDPHKREDSDLYHLRVVVPPAAWEKRKQSARLSTVAMMLFSIGAEKLLVDPVA